MNIPLLMAQEQCCTALMHEANSQACQSWHGNSCAMKGGLCRAKGPFANLHIAVTAGSSARSANIDHMAVQADLTRFKFLYDNHAT